MAEIKSAIARRKSSCVAGFVTVLTIFLPFRRHGAGTETKQPTALSALLIPGAASTAAHLHGPLSPVQQSPADTLLSAG